MPIGIRPTNDFAFKKTFGSERNKTVLMSLLNSILELSLPITDLTIENPYNEWDFQDDKLSVLDETLTIHTLEFGKYNLREEEMETASMLDCWLYWLLPAHEYEPAELLRLFPQQQIQQATETIVRISEITEDKAMYDAREKALRDHQWAIRQSYQEGIKEGKEEGREEGREEGEIKLIRTLQQILCISVSNTDELAGMNLQQLEAITADLQERIRLRWTSSDG